MFKDRSLLLNLLSAIPNSEGLVLRLKGILPSWGADVALRSVPSQNRFRYLNMMASVKPTVDRSISNNLETAITLDSETFDTDGLHSNVTNPERFTAVVAGKYLLVGHIQYAANTTGVRLCRIRKNGGAIGEVVANAMASGDHDIEVVLLVILAVSDYIELLGYQNNGGSLTIFESRTSFGIFYAGE